MSTKRCVFDQPATPNRGLPLASPVTWFEHSHPTWQIGGKRRSVARTVLHSCTTSSSTGGTTSPSDPNSVLSSEHRSTAARLRGCELSIGRLRRPIVSTTSPITLPVTSSHTARTDAKCAQKGPSS